MENIAKKHLDHKILQQNMAERAEQSLTLAYNGGLFKITLEFISAIHMGKMKPLVVKDTYQNPILIEDKRDFVDAMSARYKEVMNDWHNEYEKLRKIRKVDQL